MGRSTKSQGRRRYVENDGRRAAPGTDRHHDSLVLPSIRDLRLGPANHPGGLAGQIYDSIRQPEHGQLNHDPFSRSRPRHDLGDSHIDLFGGTPTSIEAFSPRTSSLIVTDTDSTTSGESRQRPRAGPTRAARRKEKGCPATNPVKNMKEKKSRAEQTAILRTQSDILTTMFGHDLFNDPLMPNNQRTSGLENSKTHIGEVVTVVLAKCLLQCRLEAERRGLVEEWRQQISDDVTAALESGELRPHMLTTIDDKPYAHCKRTDTSSGALELGNGAIPADYCIVHHEDNWRACRLRRCQEAFAHYLAHWKTTM